jgi:HAD superfamily hydrolase (TIGR01509 family)
MDGLLLDTERVALETYLDTASALGIDAATPALYATFIGRSWQATRVLLEEALGPRNSERMLSRWPERFEARVESGSIPRKPGVEDLLDLIGRRGTPIALATSTARHLTLRQLGAAGLLDRFGAMATGDEVVNGKPAPDIYLLAARRLGVDPASCVALEDSEPGVEAASRAGMRVIMVPDLIQPAPRIRAMAERVCPSLVEARKVLDGILRG